MYINIYIYIYVCMHGSRGGISQDFPLPLTRSPPGGADPHVAWPPKLSVRTCSV